MLARRGTSVASFFVTGSMTMRKDSDYPVGILLTTPSLAIKSVSLPIHSSRAEFGSVIPVAVQRRELFFKRGQFCITKFVQLPVSEIAVDLKSLNRSALSRPEPRARLGSPTFRNITKRRRSNDHLSRVLAGGRQCDRKILLQVSFDDAIGTGAG